MDALTKLTCTNCNSPLTNTGLKPWAKTITCPACGTSYFLPKAQPNVQQGGITFGEGARVVLGPGGQIVGRDSYKFNTGPVAPGSPLASKIQATIDQALRDAQQGLNGASGDDLIGRFEIVNRRLLKVHGETFDSTNLVHQMIAKQLREEGKID